MDKPIHIVFSYSLRYSFRPFNMDISEAEVLGGVLSSNKVVDDVRVSDTLLNRLRIPQVVLNKCHSSQISCNFQMSFGHLLSV
jgi:hypothetical protein